MNIGMLWFDNDPKVGLANKVERAAAYYQKKYGKAPTLCFVHPSMFPAQNPDEHTANPPAQEKYTTAGVEVRTNLSVLPNHFWIGSNGVT